MANMENNLKDQGKMIDRKLKKEDTLRWISLPVELRLMILQILAYEHRGLASHASVCKQWQLVMEGKAFS